MTEIFSRLVLRGPCSRPLPDHVNTNVSMRVSQFQLEELIFIDNIQVKDHIAWEYIA